MHERFQTFLNGIEEEDKRQKLADILQYIKSTYPQLNEEIKWNQPMFSDHGTFIIAFSVAKGHIAVAPEGKAINYFQQEIKDAGYSMTGMLFRIKWMDPVNYDLLDKLIQYNIEDKKDMTKFWR